MATPEKNEEGSEVGQVIDKIKVGVKVAAYTGLSAIALAASAVLSGANTVKDAASKARDDLLK